MGVQRKNGHPPIASAGPIAYLEGMEVHFNPDLQERLKQRATEEGRNLDETVQDVVARYFEIFPTWAALAAG